jgi:hypothetical protein
LAEALRARRVEVAELSDEQVAKAVMDMGAGGNTLSESQRRLLRIPLNLALLRSVGAEGLSFETTRQLFDAFWRRKLGDCRRRNDSVRFQKVVTALTEAMSGQQRLYIPGAVLDEDELTVDADVLVSEHVLVRDGQHLAFFHESFFDYAFARGRWSTRIRTVGGGRLFSDDQMAQLRLYPGIGTDELIRFFTLAPADVAFVDDPRRRVELPGGEGGSVGKPRWSEGLERECQQFAESGVAVNGAGFVQVAGDLQLREAMQKHPQDGREFSRWTGAEFAIGLGALDQLAEGEHAVVGGGLEFRAGPGDRGVAEDQLVVVGLLEGVVEVGGAAAVQA